MPSLSDKLKSLGVQVGARDITPKIESDQYTIEKVLSGESVENHFGETFVVNSHYPEYYKHGKTHLLPGFPLDTIATWAKDNRILDLDPQAFTFLDTETTGLSGGAGTYAFLIGVGRFEGDDFHLAQLFMRDPKEEPAQLAALEQFIAPCQAVVTYNGKSFDLPLLRSRFITHGWKFPFVDFVHIDLLHLSRRLWRDRLSNRSLNSIEAHILGTLRTEEDVPGWMIPSMYFDYIRSGDARPLSQVFYHNAMDILSLAALLNHISALLANPFDDSIEHGIDILSMAKFFEDIGDYDTSTRLYDYGFEHQDAIENRIPEDIYLRAIQRLALIYKRQETYERAIDLWEHAAVYHSIEAHVELAKHYEHKSKDLDKAIYWTRSAINIISSSDFPQYRRLFWADALDHRLNRLNRKFANKQ